MTDDELKAAPASMKTADIKMPKEMAGMHFRMQVSAMDCTGCGWYACEHRLIKYTTVSNCADVCPAKEKALVMKPFLTAFDLFSGVRFTLRAFESQLHEAANWDYAQKFLFTASLSDGHWQSFSYKDNLIDKFASQRPRTPLNKSNLVSNVKNSQLSTEPTAHHAQPLFELLTAFD